MRRVDMAWLVKGMFFGLMGCGEQSVPPIEAKPCVAGELKLPDGRCQPAGLPLDMPCAPGETLREDETCQVAGVPPDGCVEGFAWDGNGGCEPILPAKPCPFGLMAVPGETECHEVAPCGDGEYGDIPVESDTVFVNAATGSDVTGDGTIAKPYATIQMGVYKANAGAIVAVAAGSYTENVVLTGKPVRLWGRCPAWVEIDGSNLVPITIRESASGTAVHSLALTGDIGINIDKANNVTIDRAWIHDAYYGVQVQKQSEFISASITNSLIERLYGGGIFANNAKVAVASTVVRNAKWGPETGSFGIHSQLEGLVQLNSVVVENIKGLGATILYSQGTLEGVVIRDIFPLANQDRGYGMMIGGETTIRSSYVARSHTYGIQVVSSDVLVERTVVRETLPVETIPPAGIAAKYGPEKSAGSNVTIRDSLIADNHGPGVFVYGSRATIESTAIRDQHYWVDNFGSGVPPINFGNGVFVTQSIEGERSMVGLYRSVIERNYNQGVAIFGSDAIIEATAVRETRALPDGLGGNGVWIEGDVDYETSARVSASVVERNPLFGVLVSGAVAQIESTELIDNGSGDFQGRPTTGGLGIQPIGPLDAASVVVKGVLVERGLGMGMWIINNSNATIENSIVRNIQSAAGQKLGDGILIGGNMTYPDISIHSTRIEATARAGIVNFGGHAALEGNAIVCSKLDINGENYFGAPYSFEDLGGNLCGCPEANGKCLAVSAGLEPPPPLEPIPHP